MPTRARESSLAAQAADQIRELIVSGTLKTGQALSETALAAELGVSKTPVREALLQLKSEGLVEILPQRGTFVFEMAAAAAFALSEFRSVLEVAALRCGMRNDAAGLATAMKTIVGQMKLARTIEESIAYRSLDDRLHRCIIQYCGNAYMTDAYESIALQVQALRNRLSVDAKLNKKSLEDHRELVRHVRHGDAERAAALLKRHIAKTPADYAERLTPVAGGATVRGGGAGVFMQRARHRA